MNSEEAAKRIRDIQIGYNSNDFNTSQQKITNVQLMFDVLSEFWKTVIRPSPQSSFDCLRGGSAVLIIPEQIRCLGEDTLFFLRLAEKMEVVDFKGSTFKYYQTKEIKDGNESIIDNLAQELYPVIQGSNDPLTLEVETSIFDNFQGAKQEIFQLRSLRVIANAVFGMVETEDSTGNIVTDTRKIYGVERVFNLISDKSPTLHIESGGNFSVR
jgi:hypothetical protein